MSRQQLRRAVVASAVGTAVEWYDFFLYGVAAAKGEGVRVGICGEMAADPAAFALLVGIGVDEYSMRPAAIAAIRALLPRLSVRDITAAAHELLTGGADADIDVALSGLML